MHYKRKIFKRIYSPLWLTQRVRFCQYDATLRERFYQYDTTLRERFCQYDTLCVSGLIWFLSTRKPNFEIAFHSGLGASKCSYALKGKSIEQTYTFSLVTAHFCSNIPFPTLLFHSRFVIADDLFFSLNSLMFTRLTINYPLYTCVLSSLSSPSLHLRPVFLCFWAIIRK